MNSAQSTTYDCRKATCCGEDDPFPNFTQDRIGYRPNHEALVCVSQYTPPSPPPGVIPESDIGCLHLRTECITVPDPETGECGELLENDALICAINLTAVACGTSALAPVTGGGGTTSDGAPVVPTPPEAEFWNTAQSFCSTCPDGAVTCYTYPANSIKRASQAQADAAALSVATNRALAYRICCDNEPDYCCVGKAYTFDLTFSGGLNPKTVSVYSGSLPDGVSLSGSTLSGVPATAGTYTFVLAIADGRVVTYKGITMYAIQVTPLVLPDANYGVPYSQQMVATGAPVGATLNWYISSGALPDGLSITPGGLISGTPVAGLPATFTVAVGVT